MIQRFWLGCYKDSVISNLFQNSKKGHFLIQLLIFSQVMMAKLSTIPHLNYIALQFAFSILPLMNLACGKVLAYLQAPSSGYY